MGKVHVLNEKAPATGSTLVLTSQRRLLVAWLLVGMLPFTLQVRSFTKFTNPHKMPSNLVVPPDLDKSTRDLNRYCPVRGFHMAQVWWNIDATHYFNTTLGVVCHFVVPQYNTHGAYTISSTKVDPFYTAPAKCDEDSFEIAHYFYHGSIGYYSFYEDALGTYCIPDKIGYSLVKTLGTFDINGANLAKDNGSEEYRRSYWYGAVGMFWIAYRALVLRRSFFTCKHYGHKCDQMGEILRRKQTMVFAYESMRLSAHGATNCQRLCLLYLLAEGLMTDLFLLAANDAIFVWIQFISLGYNLSGVLLLLFEMVESMGWLSEISRLFIKRLVFSYESSLVGELFSAICQPFFLSSINKSKLRDSGSTAIAASYYVWSLVGHGTIVLVIIALIMLVRILRSVTYIRWKHGRVWAVLLAPCCVDTTLGIRNRMTMLAGYCWEDEKLYYKPEALKAFGVLKSQEADDSEFLALRKLHWVAAPTHGLYVLGTVTDKQVKPCTERPCTGVVDFFDRCLGGGLNERGFVRVRSKIFPDLNILPS